MKRCLYILLACLLYGCRAEIEDLDRPVERCADAPVALASAASFSMHGKGYVFGGRIDDAHRSNRLYEYDPAKDRWTDLGETPLTARVRPRAVAVGEDVYIGLGFDGKVLVDSSYLSDFWKWTPATNTWTQLADYPSLRSVGPVMETDGEYIYAAFGGKQNFERWIFRYDIPANRWIQLKDGVARMASYPPRAHSTCGSWCAGRLFVGAGYTKAGSSDFWVEAEMRDDSVVWHRRTPVSGKRHNSTAATDGQSIYMAGGTFYGGTLTTGSLYDDILCYDPQKDVWTRLGHLPDGERENMISWVIDGYLYIGLGDDKRNKPCSQFYRIRL